MRYRCGDWEIDLGRAVVLRDGSELPLRRKAFSLLAYLVRHRDRIVSRQELLDAVWPDARVSGATLDTTLRELRQALREPAGGGCIRTLRGRGYCFEAPLEEVIAAEVRSLAEARPGDPHAAIEAPFVGRGDVLAAGEEALCSSLEGRGRALLLAGEAGIGKSRALFELSRRASERGFAVHVGRCLEEEGAPACWPWMQILRGVLEDVGESERHALAGRHEEAFALLSMGPHSPNATAEDSQGPAARFRLFDSVARMLAEAATAAPRALILDDLHRADATSARMLRHLMGVFNTLPVVVFAGLRDREVPPQHPVASILAEFHGSGTRIDLSGLDLQSVGEIAAELLGRAPTLETSRALRARTEGNPLFVVEIARSLRRSGTSASAEDVIRASPSSVRHVIRARLAGLPTRTRSLLEAAAVFGRECDLDLLRQLLPDPDIDRSLETAAETLAEAEKGSGRLRFSHILVRDVLYDDLPRERRAVLHRAAGHALETLHAVAPDEHLDELAHHFGQAASLGEAEKAQRYATRAAERALAKAAYEEAAQRVDAALRALEVRFDRARGALALETARAERADLLVLLGRARWSAGETDAARAAFEEAARLASEVAASETQARAALGYAGRTDATPGVNAAAVALLEDALDRLPSDDSSLRAEILARLGTELYYAGDPSRCDRLTIDALDMAERCADVGVLGYALSARHFALLRPEIDPRRRLELTDRLEALASASRSREVLALGLEEKFFDLLELGDSTGMHDTLRDFERLAEELRQPFFQWMASAYRGARVLLDGRVAQAEQLAHQTLALGQSFDSPNAVPLFAGQLFCVRREQGRLPELEPLIRSIADEQPVFGVVRAALAEALAAAGRLQDARDSLARIMARDLEEVPRTTDGWLGILSVLASAAVTARDVERMGRLYELLAPYTGRMIPVGHASSCNGAVDHHLGRLAAATGDADLADEHLDAAAVLHRRAGARLWLAHTQREHARVLWKSGAAHERERARELAEEARATYAALELPHWEEWTRELLR